MRKATVLASILSASAIVLSACGGTPNDGSTAAPNTAAAKAGGTLTIGAAQGITDINPVTKANAWEQVLFSLMWDSLVSTGKDGTPQADLAEKWSSSADLKTWTFTLKDGVKFSNGKALTAADVVSTVKYYQDPDTATQLKNNVKPITDVRADGRDVVFTLSSANALFPQSLDMMKIVDTGSMASMEKDPAVTGPFKVKEFVPDDHLTLERNPNYAGAAPKLDGIKLVKAADASAAVTQLQSGDLDALWSVPLSQVSAITGNSSLQVIKPSDIGQYVSWEVDTTAAPFDNVYARQALAHAIDQEAILKAAYFGQGVTSTTNNPLTADNPDYGGKLVDYTYNLDEAKRLFAKAGVKPGATFTWWGVSNQYPEWNISAQILQASLKKIGITLKIVNNDIGTWPNKFYPAGKSFPGLIVPNFQSYPTDAADLLLFLQKGRCECNWNNTAFDGLYEQALGTADPAARKDLWGQAQALISEQAPIFVPVQFATVTAAKRDITGLWVDGAGNVHLEDAAFTK